MSTKNQANLDRYILLDPYKFLAFLVKVDFYGDHRVNDK